MKSVQEAEIDDQPGASSADFAKKMAKRRWLREAQMLSTALEKIVAVAQDNQRLTRDVAERYTMSCTFISSLRFYCHCYYASAPVGKEAL